MTPMAAGTQPLSGFEQHALSGATVALPSAAFVLSANPAAISGNRLSWFGTRHFGLDALQEGGLSYQYNGSPGRHIHALALELHHFGFPLYREVALRTGAAIRSGNTRLGVSAGWVHHSIAGYSSAYTLLLNTGVQYHTPDQRFIIGAAMYDIPMHEGGHFVPGNVMHGAVGITYRSPESVYLMVSVRQIPGYQPDLHAGISYTLNVLTDMASLTLSGGYQTVFEQWSAGLAVHFMGLHPSYAVRSHPVLGLSHGFGLELRW